jgi:hypothetical protein
MLLKVATFFENCHEELLSPATRQVHSDALALSNQPFGAYTAGLVKRFPQKELNFL